MKTIRLLNFIIFSLIINIINAQNSRIWDYNSIVWVNNFATFQINSKFSVHAEVQFRRVEWGLKPQQELYRTGLNYHLKPNVVARLGYAFIETYPYGEISINAYGKAFPEHRMYQLLALSDKYNQIEVNHRYMLEQRWVGSYDNSLASSVSNYLFMNRLRYMIRAQIPLANSKTTRLVPFLAGYNEVFLGFGKNVNQNIFDQNRTAALLGLKIGKQVKIEAGYFLQILQLGRRVNNQNVFQKNEGGILNAYYTFNLHSKPTQ